MPLPSFLSRLLLAAMLLLAWSLPARAQLRLEANTEAVALASQVEVLEDQGGTLDFSTVAQAAREGRFRPARGQGEINFGYSASVFWLHFSVEPHPAGSRDWLLEIAYPSLDRVELFQPLADGSVRHLVTGDRQPFSSRPYSNRNLLLPLQLAPQGPQSLFLRVQSEGSLTVPLTLWAPEAFRRHNQDAYAGFSLYYGMLLALGLYNLLLYFSLRDRSYLAYVAFVASMAVGQLSLNGLGNEYLWPEWPAWGNVALPSGFAATGFFGALFTRFFLATRRTVPRLDKLILALAAGFAFAALAPAFLPYRLAAVLTSLLGAVFSTVAVVAGVRCRLAGHAGARYFLLAWSLLLLGVAMLALRNLGWLPTNLFTTYGMQIGSALEMLLLSFALADRIHVARQEKDLAQAEALSAKQSMVEALQRSEQELENRVAIRTGELSEANRRLRENEHLLQRMARHDPLTGLANRLLLDDRVAHGLASAKRNDRHLALLLIDLDGFKPVNDAYGHALGDKLLVVLADRLVRCVRAVDTVARLGGDEFVIVLEDLSDEAAAIQVATKVVAEMARPALLEGQELSVTASVGLAFHPRDGKDTATLLKQADQAMYTAKHGGRNTFRRA